MDLGFVMRSVSGNTLERERSVSFVSGLTMVSVHDGCAAWHAEGRSMIRAFGGCLGTRRR